MRKKSSRFLKKSLEILVQGVAVFAVAGVIGVAFAAVRGGISWPDSDPGPVSGVLGIYQGVTDTAYSLNGGNVGNTGKAGYAGANALCDAKFAGSHVCMTSEILNSYAHGAVVDLGGQSMVWISNGPPAFVANANDCRGWQRNASNFFGAVWTNDGQGILQTCDKSYRFACCL